MPAPRILAFAGSLRTDSYNKKLINVAAAGARDAGAEVTVIDLRDYPLPIYDGDLEAADGLPDNAKKLKKIFLEHAGLLIAAPEYNSSISAVLKNTIDWVSRPESKTEPPLMCFDGKIAGLMSASPGALGGLRGLVHVRAILQNIRVMVIPQQIAISRVHEAFGEAGDLRDDGQRTQVHEIAARVSRLVSAISR